MGLYGSRGKQSSRSSRITARVFSDVPSDRHGSGKLTTMHFLDFVTPLQVIVTPLPCEMNELLVVMEVTAVSWTTRSHPKTVRLVRCLSTMARLVSVLLAVNVSFCVRSRRRPRILIQRRDYETEKKKRKSRIKNHEMCSGVSLRSL